MRLFILSSMYSTFNLPTISYGELAAQDRAALERFIANSQSGIDATPVSDFSCTALLYGIGCQISFWPLQCFGFANLSGASNEHSIRTDAQSTSLLLPPAQIALNNQ